MFFHESSILFIYLTDDRLIYQSHDDCHIYTTEDFLKVKATRREFRVSAAFASNGNHLDCLLPGIDNNAAGW